MDTFLIIAIIAVVVLGFWLAVTYNGVAL